MRVQQSLHLDADPPAVMPYCNPNGSAHDPAPYAAVTITAVAFSWGIYSNNVTTFNRLIDALTVARDRLAEAQRTQEAAARDVRTPSTAEIAEALDFGKTADQHLAPVG